LPTISWRACTPHRYPRVWESDKANGNIRVSELAVLSALAAHCDPETDLFEIGTFDGRTALNLAFSAPDSCRIHTLDLAPEMETEFSLAPGERHMVERAQSGARISAYRGSHQTVTARIHQLYGDSGSFDFSPYHNRCSLVFVDGSHAYDYVHSDTEAAMKMVKPGGAIIWHDYGIWEGVTRALEEIEARDQPGLRNIQGTSLVYWRSAGA